MCLAEAYGGGDEWASASVTSALAVQQSFTLTGMLPPTETSFIVRWNRPAGALQFDGAGSGQISIGTRAEHVYVNAEDFNGNLSTSDDTVQEVAQKFDDLAIVRDLSWTPTLASGFSPAGITITVDSSSAYQVGNSITYRFTLRVNRGTAPNLDSVDLFLTPPHEGPFITGQWGSLPQVSHATEVTAPYLQTYSSNRLRVFFNLKNATTNPVLLSGFGVYTIN